MAGSITSTNNLDINSIVSQLMTVERQPIAKLDRKEAGYQAKLSAYGSIKGALASFQSTVQGLSSSSKFQSVKATPSDTTVFSASASSIAVAGTYSLEISSLAQSQKLVTAGQSSSTATIGAGTPTTLTFDFGTISGGTYTAYVPSTGTGGTYAGAAFTSNGTGAKTVTINSTNNSLQGIRDAINAANIGVTAAIVNDGSGTPYRLTLASNSMGASNSLNISVSGDATIRDMLTNNPGSVAVVAGSSTGAAASKVAAGNPDAAAGTIAAGTLIVTTSAGSASVGAITLPGGAVANGQAIATAISTALASLDGGAVANGSATADGVTGQITWNTGTNGANTLSMGGFASDSTVASANRTALATQTGFDAAQLGSQEVGAQKMAQSVVAQNAVFTVNGVQVSKTSNTVSDVVQGVTLTLGKVTASPVTLIVERDTGAIGSAVSGFVKAYNDLANVLKELSAYDAVAQKGAILQGDATVRSLQSQLRSILGTPAVGTSGALTRLSDVGVSFQKDGTLALNQTKLNNAIASNFSGIAGLFAATGAATDSLVSYSGATSSAKAGSYAINVTQIATRHSSLGNMDVAATGNNIASGTTINVALDGVPSTSVALTAGTYTDAQLAAMIQSAINGTSAFSSAGASVSITIDSGKLRLTSGRYGTAAYGVSMTDGAGTAISTLVGALSTDVAGVDVAGTIGDAATTGYGQTLVASDGDPQGISVVVNGGAAGARGTLNYSHGYAYLLDRWVTSSLTSDGILNSRTDGIGKTITDIGKQRAALENRLIGIEKRYRAQFTALDTLLASMNTTSTYLTQQLDMLAKLK